MVEGKAEPFGVARISATTLPLASKTSDVSVGPAGPDFGGDAGGRRIPLLGGLRAPSGVDGGGGGDRASPTGTVTGDHRTLTPVDPVVGR